MVKSILFLTSSSCLILILVVLLFLSTGHSQDVTAQNQLVKHLGLTDLALCSEARYTRHPSQADLFSPFQDFPGSFEHFPTGSLLSPDPVGFSGRVKILSRMENP
jgi:hypothetical protein